MVIGRNSLSGDGEVPGCLMTSWPDEMFQLSDGDVLDFQTTFMIST